jgi:hypothetical protein
VHLTVANGLVALAVAFTVLSTRDSEGESCSCVRTKLIVYEHNHLICIKNEAISCAFKPKKLEGNEKHRTFASSSREELVNKVKD